MKKGKEATKCKVLYFKTEEGDWSYKAKIFWGFVVCFSTTSNGVKVLT